MTLFSLKTLAAAVALSVPMLASAAAIGATKYTDTLTFSLGIENDALNNKYDLNTSSSTELYDVVVNGLWTNTSYYLVASTAPDFVNKIDGMGFKYEGKGTLDLPSDGLFDHLVGGAPTVSAPTQTLQMTFAGLSTGRYTVKFTGYWDKITNLAGKNSDWGSTPGTTDLTLGSVNLVSAVPEPETYAMLLAGLGLMGSIIARRRKSAGQA